MPNYTPLQIHTIFETIWEDWINKDGESSALKAVTFFLKENKKEDLIQACEAYRLENLSADPKFTYKLANFLNLDHYRDVLEANNLDKLRAKRDAAVEVITLWNSLCRNHWSKVRDIDTRIPTAQDALSNKYFKENWKEALDLAVKIFAYPFREGDPREKLKLTFRWFTTISHDRHTVLKIMEGEFGGPNKERYVKVIKTDPIDFEARKKLAEEMKILFPTIKFEEPKKENPIKEKLILTKEAKELADNMRSELGKKPFVRYDKNDIQEISREVTDTFSEGSPDGSESPNDWEFD